MPDLINPPASTYQPILDALKGRDSKNAMTFDELQTAIDMPASTLALAINEMYERGMLNKATQIKAGVRSLLLWPTGVIKSYGDYGRQTPPPRRDEMTNKEANAMTEPAKIMNTDNVRAEKPKALRILEYIEAHPGCGSGDIIAATGIVGPQAYLKYHIKHGKVICAPHGLRKNTFTLAAGLTAITAYNNSLRSTGTINKAEANKHKAEEYVIPEFLRKPPRDAFAVADSVDEKLGDFAQTMKDIRKEQCAEDEPDKPEAKVLKLDLPQRLDAETCINMLLKLMPHSHVITIRKARDGGGIAEIDGRTLAEQISPNLGDIDVTLSALNTINQAMPA